MKQHITVLPARRTHESSTRTKHLMLILLIFGRKYNIFRRHPMKYYIYTALAILGLGFVLWLVEDSGLL